ncbi:MAG: AraC family ligand binding domain-containing protein, partial [Akkermansiaceae bacterium]|nr:AraC family ligand binding domain-containing protein [Armatimonadota bacterium]
MEPQDKSVSIRAWSSGDLLLESYRYAAGPPGATPPHTHDEYQFCLSLNFPGENRYRGANVPIPERSLSIVHPGETHSSRDLESRPYETDFRLIYLPVAYLQQMRNELTGRHAHATAEPFFRESVFHGKPFTRLLAAHTAREQGANPLEEQSLLLHAFSALLIREGQATPPAA